MWTMKKPIFKLWNSNVTSVDFTCAEAQDISALTIHCVNSDRIGRAVIPPQTRNLVRCRKTSTPVGAGRPAGEELGYVEALGGRAEQGSAINDLVNVTTKSEYKSNLLVASETVKGFEKPWSILIDSGASGNYVQRRSLEGSHQFVKALKAYERDVITVRLETGAHVTVPKVPLNLVVKF